jgi:chromosome segregation ATPase
MSEETTQQLPNEDLRRILSRLDSIDARLGTLEDKVDRRLQETSPIWERALAEIAEVRVEMREGLEKSRAEMNTGLRRIDRQIDVLNRNILDVRTDLRYLDERVTKLESEPTQ